MSKILLFVFKSLNFRELPYFNWDFENFKCDIMLVIFLLLRKEINSKTPNLFPNPWTKVIYMEGNLIAIHSPKWM